MQAPRGSDPRIRESYKTYRSLPLSCRCSDHMSSKRVEQSPGSTPSYSYQGIQCDANPVPAEAVTNSRYPVMTVNSRSKCPISRQFEIEMPYIASPLMSTPHLNAANSLPSSRNPRHNANTMDRTHPENQALPSAAPRHPGTQGTQGRRPWVVATPSAVPRHPPSQERRQWVAATPSPAPRPPTTHGRRPRSPATPRAAPRHPATHRAQAPHRGMVPSRHQARHQPQRLHEQVGHERTTISNYHRWKLKDLRGKAFRIGGEDRSSMGPQQAAEVVVVCVEEGPRRSSVGPHVMAVPQRRRTRVGANSHRNNTRQEDDSAEAGFEGLAGEGETPKAKLSLQIVMRDELRRGVPTV